jgi:hypothetical protein
MGVILESCSLAEDLLEKLRTASSAAFVAAFPTPSFWSASFAGQPSGNPAERLILSRCKPQSRAMSPPWIS